MGIRIVDTSNNESMELHRQFVIDNPILFVRRIRQRWIKTKTKKIENIKEWAT